LETLDSKKDFYKVILENISDGVYFCDRERRIVYWNGGAERITGYSAKQVRGSSCADGILTHVDQQGTSLCQNGCPLSATLADGQPREAHAYLHHRAGHRVPVVIRTNPIYSPDGDVEGVIETFSDNSALLNALRRVDELSIETETDPLTGVGNRRGMITKLDACVGEKRRAQATTGVLFVDIDHFKNVNDTYGHDTGDRVLKMVAQTLKHNLRATDGLARWGGEEFLALLLHTNENSLGTTAEKLRMLVARSYLKVDDSAVRVTISLGATLIRPADTRESLVARADALLYRSKSAGRDRYTLES
jgi:diguanylate cyclase (GGDEF)-like protein/PAS domain S-box-containing protein